MAMVCRGDAYFADPLSMASCMCNVCRSQGSDYINTLKDELLISIEALSVIKWIACPCPQGKGFSFAIM